MGVDTKTQPTYINIVLDDNSEYLNVLRKQAEEEDQNQDGETKLSLTNDKHVFNTEEYYFEDDSNSLFISGEMISDKGKSYISICIPLSDIVLIDILQYATKKLNKLKTAMETLT